MKQAPKRKKTTKQTKVKKKPMRLTKKIKVKDLLEPVEVPSERAFWVHDGPAVATLKELYDAIEKMTAEQFDFHTVRSGNDFARWIRDVLLDSECADKVEVVVGQKEMIKVISKFI